MNTVNEVRLTIHVYDSIVTRYTHGADDSCTRVSTLNYCMVTNLGKFGELKPIPQNIFTNIYTDETRDHKAKYQNVCT